MKQYLLSLLLIGLTISTIAQEQYSKVKIYTDDSGLQQLIQLGVGIDHGQREKGEFFISDFSSSDIRIMQANNFDIEIIIADVAEYYKQRNNEPENRNDRGSDNCSGNAAENEFVTPTDFNLGSMGGFYTYQEFLDHLDTMYAKYPNLITQRAAIDTFQTHEGRPVYWLKISDNPTIDETEPKVLYTALHHAREPASLSQVIMYMYYLLENYGTIDEVTNIVDNTELYFIPMINPDGYIQNYTTNPNGGGMWRKNKRNNGDGTTGVDLNRNYGHSWGLDDNGSSPNTNSDTYRGPAPFSEPELQAVEYLSEAHQFLMVLNYHTYGNLLIYPWGFAPSLYTPDSAIFVEFAKVMTEQNNYTYGTGDQTVGYVTNGDSDDWQYGEQITKPKSLSFTPEAGDQNDGFWPTINRIEPISKSNLRQNLNFAHLAGKYARTEDLSPATIATTSSYIDFEIKRLGLDSPATFTVSLSPISSQIASVGNAIAFSTMSLLETRIDSISIDLVPTVQPGDQITFLMQIDNGAYTVTDTITKTYGVGTSIFTDDANAIANWTVSSSWGLTTADYHSAPSSITDSPGGDHGDNVNNNIQLNDTIDLTNAIDAKLNFWARWELETGYDYVQVQASTDYGITWIPLCGQYTKIGNSSQDQGNPVYNGFQFEWVLEEMDLSDYLGQKIMIRFRLKSDPFTTEDGFYFDDVDIKVIESEGTSLSEIGLNSSLTVFPNPNDGSFTVAIAGNDTEQFTLSIVDVVGRQIRSTKSINGNSTTEIQLQESTGIYFVVVRNGEGILVGKQKIVIE
ncbi:MAG: immune inhibitor A [Flavobacteriales bacterium]|nr:immune inhibitor A [Flavobacteriales bacterium]